MQVWLSGVGLYASGLPDWQTSQPVLRGEVAWAAQPLGAVHLPLPPAERRRTSASTRVAWAAAVQALAASGLNGAGVNTVFACSGGDGAILHQLCEALASPTREVSPTSFHNSVHNAPAGYYSIAQRSQDPSTSLGAHPTALAAGLLEATLQAVTEQRPVLLVAYELAAPFPLAPHWPARHDFAVALLLTPLPGAKPLAQLTITLRDIATPMTTPMATAAAAAWQNPTAPAWQRQAAQDNRMADVLPLLSAQALGTPTTVRLDYLDNLDLEVAWRPQ